MNGKHIGRGIAAAVFALLGLGAALGGVWLALTNTDTMPVLVGSMETARDQVGELLELVSQGEYEAAGQRMLGTPSLGADRKPTDEAGAVLWDAFVDSFSYELVGECYASESGVVQDVRITCLELSSVTGVLRQRTQDALNQRLEEAEDVSEIYDEDNNFREDVVMAALVDATRQAIELDGTSKTIALSVKLISDGEQWLVVPQDDLLSAISGGILG